MRSRSRRSITYRMTAWISGVSTAIFLLVGIVIGKEIDRQFRAQNMTLLTGKIALVEHLVKEASLPKGRSFPELLNDSLIGHDELGIEILSSEGLVYRSKGAAFPGAEVSPSQAENLELFTREAGDSRTFQGIKILLAADQAAKSYIVTIVTDTTKQADFMRAFSNTLWGVVGLAALLTGFAVWYITVREMWPLKAIRAEAERITAQHLNNRLSTELVPEEMVGLVESLNTMLGRLEEAFQRLSDFSSDLAHELRTPVTNLLMNTQLSLSKARTVEQYQETLLSNAEELERLTHMISDMLFLAKSDHDLMMPNREEVNLRKEVEALFDFYDAVASEKGIRVTRSGEAKVDGDPLMLRRALSNLMSNAFRHADAGGEVKALLVESEAKSSVSIINTGPDIAAEHLPRLFDRFYRVDGSRQRFGEGSGLGLAITRSILQAHDGKVTAYSNGGITKFEIEIPKQARG